jgi:hypothetical protein
MAPMASSSQRPEHSDYDKSLNGATPEIMALSPTQNIRDRFITPSLFGAGFVESVSDEELRKIAREQATQPRSIQDLFEKFLSWKQRARQRSVDLGWAAQHASLAVILGRRLSKDRHHVAAAAQRQHPAWQTSRRRRPDPEDATEPFGQDASSRISCARYRPHRVSCLRWSEEAKEIEEGSKYSGPLGALPATCLNSRRLGPANWSMPERFGFQALGSKKFHPYSDFLLHDIGNRAHHSS